jgi:RNA-splicing ligase RtcB
MNVTKLAIKAKDINFEELDAVINKHVPSGMTARSKSHRNAKEIPFDQVLAPINRDRAEKSIGTLGGGNHFIEVNEDEDGFIYLVIHSGSRNIGKTVAEYYQDVAIKRLSENRKETDVKIEQLKAEGRQAEISEFLKESKKNRPAINKALAYVEGKDMEDYIHDLTIAQQYALVNRNTMAEVILEQMGWDVVEKFDTIHNYIDVENMILRKGAISAQKGEVVIIPMNMRDGSLICVGKGNPDWNFSGPHGAGRLMSRSKAKELINLEEFKETMKDVWSTSVVQSTLDESPFAYKPMDEIIQNVKESVDILKVIKPLYNFKAK